MIAILFIGFFMVVFSLFLTEVSVNYGVEYDNTTFNTFNKIDEMRILTDQVKLETDITVDRTFTDILGGFFSGGYKALKLTGSSFDLFKTMSDESIDNSNMGAAGGYLKIVIGSVVLILIFIGVFIAAIVKRDL